MKKFAPVVGFAVLFASAMAQEAANPKPAPEKNNGAFVAIFCSLIAVGISVAAAINASRSKQASQKASEGHDSENPAS